MWLASYVVHFRKVHWRAGADWLYGHLLDGDLASNHLSWQWVAATGSHKAYLFNAENVARYAPKAWHSAGSVVDNSYEALDRMARDAGAVHKPHPRAARVEEPALYTQPPPGLNLPAATATSLPTNAWLVHPWALRDISDVREAPSGMTLVGAFVPTFHAQWPWSAKRWQFVAARMADVCKNSFWFEGSVPPSARFLHDLHLQPHGAHWPITQSIAAPRLFAEPASACTSFTQFYKRVSGSLQF
jgi:deoxyribodipyrimidine photo-lyase